MLVAPAPAAISENIQAGILKSMVPDPRWFNGDQMKFKDWWRGMQLFLKSNRIIKTDNRITAILAHLRGDIAGIYIQRKLDELDEKHETQDWEDFIKEIKTTFSDKTKVAGAEWKIKSFKQEKKNITNFMIEFNTLAMKVDINKLHAILLKKNIRLDIIKTILNYLPIAALEILKEWKVVITSVRQWYKSMERRHNYKISIETTYRGQDQPMDIRKSNNNFRNRKPKCFNCNKYRHMAKECQLKKKEDK